MRPIKVRATGPEDFPGIIATCRAVYPQSLPYGEDQLESQIAQFPEGQFVAVEEGTGRVLGMAASLVLKWADYQGHEDWREFTDSGTFRNHDPERGLTLYGAEIMVHPDARRRGVGSRLYEARRRLVKRLGLLRIRAGARLRGYHRYADSAPADEYAARVVRGEITDPTLTFQLRHGFRVAYVVSNYLHADPESLGWAAVIEWLNPEVATDADYAAGDPRFRAMDKHDRRDQRADVSPSRDADRPGSASS